MAQQSENFSLTRRGVCSKNLVMWGYFFAAFSFKAGIIPPHPRSLVTAAKNREAIAAGALSSDVLEGAEKDDEQVEENTENS